MLDVLTDRKVDGFEHDDDDDDDGYLQSTHDYPEHSRSSSVGS